MSSNEGKKEDGINERKLESNSHQAEGNGKIKKTEDGKLDQPPHSQHQKKPKKEKQEKKEDVQESKSTILEKKPDWVDSRIQLFESIKKKREEEALAKSKDIIITLPNNSTKTGKSFVTTPYDIAHSISQGLAQNAIVSRVNGQLWDLGRPLEADCKLEILKFDDRDAQEVFWHSSSHILGEVLEFAYQGLLAKGPPLPDEEHSRFFYDVYVPNGVISEKDFKKLEELANKFVEERQKFERLLVTKEEALELFKYNKFKFEILSAKVPDGVMCTVYRCGNLIDPCRGPHIYNSSQIKAFEITKNSSAYWKADSNNAVLQRAYGISFPDKKLLKDWKERQALFKERDHRVIGPKQELWTWSDLSPGCVFLMPRGTRIFNKLQEMIRKEYRNRGFEEVQTPNIFSSELFMTSGHWDNYKDNMFLLPVDGQQHALKPMNCPSHCLLYKFRSRSYRELPLRFADFGVLHRNELKGALTGMTRVRRFQQDDAHIFCREDQIETEMTNALEFLKHVYGIFGFTFKLNLSTRPEKNYLGTVETWDRAEKQLANALNRFGQKWGIKKGDGAFYGPKIDVKLEDALKREHQCGTIQLDFQLPQKFDLHYVNEEITGERLSRPVMIHRAIYGSLERFMAIISEQYGGKWPFWLSPRQIIVLPISEKTEDYAKEVRRIFHEEGYYVEVDDSNNNVDKKIALAQTTQINIMLVVGPKEALNKTVNLRIRDEKVQTGEKSIDEVKQLLASWIKDYK